MTTMTSPTRKLIEQQCSGDIMREQEPKSEVEQLINENYALRRKLAHLTAQYIWAEGGSHARINSEIRQYGYKLEKMTNGYDPKIVPITMVVSETNKEVVTPPMKMAGRIAESHEGRA